MDKFCDFEWSPAYGVHKIGCDFPQGKVELFGDYHKHQCGIRVYDLDSRDRGTWMCEVEKYYTGFSRRYGEYRTNVLNLMISLVSPKKIEPFRANTGSIIPSTVLLNPQKIVKSLFTKKNLQKSAI